MKLEERKYTTEKGLEALENLIKSLEEKIRADIEPISSNTMFNCRHEFDNGEDSSDFNYDNWVHTQCYFKIDNGYINLISEGEETEFRHTKAVIASISECTRIDFSKCLKALEDILNKYNEVSKEKDDQIKKFLELCTAFNNEV